MSDSIDWDALRQAASDVRARAHAPYSKFQVGACIVAEDGQRFSGANVENASYGLCLCAERSAIAQAVAAGVKRFTALCIVAPGPDPATPCGMCRQVFVEFPPGFPIRTYTPEGAVLETSVAELLPHAFTPDNLKSP